METIRFINYIFTIVFIVCYSYQFFYIFISLLEMLPFMKKHFKKNRLIENTEVTLHRYAVLIAARNEESVIADLIKSIKAQDYPAELVDIYVVADNCTDQTKLCAQNAGAVVWERFDSEHVGKGYALNFLLKKINLDYPDEKYDAFFVFDADNVLNPDYITQMNKTYSAGYKVITSYRNSKNYGDNLITAGYSLWFLREAKYLNNSRFLLNTSCAISGTGFLFARETIEKCGGWNFFLLTEDIEFSVYNAIEGEKIGYCKDAVLYDEQPTKFSQSWNQRMRWSRGYLQVFGKYGTKLLKGIFTKGSFSCFDMTMNIMPAMILTLASIILNVVGAVIGFLTHGDLLLLTISVLELILNTVLIMFIVGIITTITEWKQIHCSTFKKILYSFTFPLFMLTYIPISIVALFKKVKWKKIEHNKSRTVEEIINENN